MSARADMGILRYAQCWEDADVLLDALAIKPGQTAVSIASAGDNSFSLLTRDPARVVALDLSPAQIACVELRAAMYRRLDHAGMLELVGSRASDRRPILYLQCRDDLSLDARRFWDARPDAIARGMGGSGKFEDYLRIFRTRALPLVHDSRTIDAVMAWKSLAERRRFYDARWDTWRWNALFRVFFSRIVMGRLGRDPAFFDQVEGDVAERILARTKYALTELDTSENPYLHWILTGSHPTALPHALRPENFAKIRANLDRLEWRLQSVEAFVASEPPRSAHAFNFSDIFEYVSVEAYREMLARVADVGAPGARIAYWNLFAPRSRPADMADRIRALPDLSKELHARDKAWFYSAFVVEEVI